MDDEPPHVDARVHRDQQAWVATRRALNANRHVLARVAARLYPEATRLADTALLVGPGWIPDEPVNLAAVEHDRTTAAEPFITGTEPATGGVRPRRSVVRSFPRYTTAIRDLAHPHLFDNRHSWRLTDLAWGSGKGRMEWADSCYFAGIDVYEAVAHELAAVAFSDTGQRRPGEVVMRDLPFRRLIGNPFDLARRTVLAAISTVTIRRDSDGSASFLLHRRDSKAVAMAAGLLSVIPSGMFQPSSLMPAAMAVDFDPWRNFQREFSEELLGHREHDADGTPVDYCAEPFASLDAAREAGRLRMHCLGVGVDPLTLIGEVLTCAVFDADVFDELSADFVAHNEEGTMVAQLVPFTAESMEAISRSGRMHPAGGACLELAWRHRDVLIGQVGRMSEGALGGRRRSVPPLVVMRGHELVAALRGSR